MQRFEGVICYCCGEVLGSNDRCGDRAITSASVKRPPCLWVHTDSSIVQRCISAMKKAGTNEVKAPDVSVLPVGTPVFVPPLMGGHGHRGVVIAWSSKSKQYSIRFENGNVGSVGPHLLLRYVDKGNVSLYPSDALPFDSSVFCLLTSSDSSVVVDTVCCIIQGAAIDDSNHAVYYDVGRNCTPKQFFIAADVTLVVEEQLQNVATSKVPVGAASKPKAAPRASSAPSAAPSASSAPSAAVPGSSAPSAAFPGSSAPSAAVPRTFIASQFDEDDSDTDCASVSATLQVGESVVCDGKGLGIVLGRCLNRQNKRVSKYTVQCNNSTLTLRWNLVHRATRGDPKAGKSAQKAKHPQARGEAPGFATLPVPQKQARAPSSSSAESSSSDSESAGGKPASKKQSAEGRKRAAKFNLVHDDEETLVIFQQVQANIPWLHSRNSQKQIWDFHLKELWKEGHALELQGHKDAVKTISAWAQNTCKTRRTSRLAELRKSGVASVEHDVVDDVAYRWEMKVCGDAEDSETNQMRAQLFRDIATSTAVDLHATAAKIEDVRHRRYSTGKGKKAGAGDATTPTKQGTPSTTSTTGSPQDNAKTALLRQLTDLTKHTAEQEAKDAAVVTQLVNGIAAQFAQGGSSQALDMSGELLLLRNFLQGEDSSLVNWAPQIHAALGITEGAHFKELTKDDINQAPGIPVLQRKRIIAIAKRFY